mgnify:CR=1 FL=1
MPGVEESTDRIASVWTAICSGGAERRIVAVFASASDQRVARRPEASERARAKTQRKVIAPAVKIVSQAVGPEGGTTSSARVAALWNWRPDCGGLGQKEEGSDVEVAVLLAPALADALCAPSVPPLVASLYLPLAVMRPRTAPTG